jgi:hypothetical protein
MVTYVNIHKKQQTNKQAIYNNLHLLISISQELTGIDPNRALTPGIKAVPIFLVYKMRPP